MLVDLQFIEKPDEVEAPNVTRDILSRVDIHTVNTPFGLYWLGRTVYNLGGRKAAKLPFTCMFEGVPFNQDCTTLDSARRTCAEHFNQRALMVYEAVKAKIDAQQEVAAIDEAVQQEVNTCYNVEPTPKPRKRRISDI